MKSSKGGEGKNFNPTVSETKLHLAQASLMSGNFPKAECCANPTARSHKTGLSAGMFRTVFWQILELCFWYNSIGFSLTHLRLESLENLDMSGNWDVQKWILNFSPTPSVVCAVVSASLWCTTWLWRSRKQQQCAPYKSQTHGLCVCVHVPVLKKCMGLREQGIQSYRIWQWCWFSHVIKGTWRRLRGL